MTWIAFSILAYKRAQRERATQNSVVLAEVGLVPRKYLDYDKVLANAASSEPKKLQISKWSLSGKKGSSNLILCISITNKVI